VFGFYTIGTEGTTGRKGAKAGFGWLKETLAKGEFFVLW